MYFARYPGTCQCIFKHWSIYTVEHMNRAQMKLYGIVFLLGYLTCGFRRIVAGYVQNFRHDTFKTSKKAPGIPKFRGSVATIPW
jgi:hypothetical protein